MIQGIQIIGIIFALAMFYMTFLNQKKNRISAKEYFFWMMVWTVFLITAIFPEIISPIARTFSMKTLDLLVIAAILFMLGLGYYTYLDMRRTKDKVDMLVRNMAMKK